ncbi:hypothetical protein EVAR_23999_1 [Eumeta japonica]|uniref:Uncharacterized protein n=1 Tax=Eumeta variegata TaxID=151549 RepID=A0A4C1WB79_EUMVA|nr:hypothetical protein EVAR_23999_1 [Eumeta japonica]
MEHGADYDGGRRPQSIFPADKWELWKKSSRTRKKDMKNVYSREYVDDVAQRRGEMSALSSSRKAFAAFSVKCSAVTFEVYT